jgi:hypothetical protein
MYCTLQYNRIKKTNLKGVIKMTTLRVYNLAYAQLLELREREEEIKNRSEKELGRESEIGKARLERIDSEIKYLHSEILRLEKEGV